MSALLFLLAASTTLQPPGILGLSLPIDWQKLTPLPYRSQPVVTERMSKFVAAEIAYGKCDLPPRHNGRHLLSVDIAVMLSDDGTVRATIPRAIDCPSVEQYSAGLVSSFARNNLSVLQGGSGGWYRATVTYNWS